ncbi:gamma-tubulin complex component 2 [Phtheirospermum japonicum]|uniref:Gamma-tubulin complex component n=1 Tax=Phtheirospermum japonicum TaxID=374723 RepID=A0A830C5C0_9LAMI|nr:gamma-tubulin complex component 2 [Phtheirospermum japonicum]
MGYQNKKTSKNPDRGSKFVVAADLVAADLKKNAKKSSRMSGIHKKLFKGPTGSGAGPGVDNPIGCYHAAIQELIVIDDLLSALVGIEGQYISIRRVHEKDDSANFQVDASMDQLMMGSMKALSILIKKASTANFTGSAVLNLLKSRAKAMAGDHVVRSLLEKMSQSANQAYLGILESLLLQLRGQIIFTTHPNETQRGWVEQVPWPTCSEGESKKNRSRHLGHKVIQLRKACSHPYLFPSIEPEPYQEEFEGGGDFANFSSKISGASFESGKVLCSWN